MDKFILKLCTSMLALFILIAIPTYANSNDLKNEYSEQIIVQPYFTNISIFQNLFDISSDGKVSVTVYLTAQNVDSVKVDANLQQFKNGFWTTIKSWSNTSVGTNAGLSGTYYVAKGYNYRLVSNGTVYKSISIIETTTFTSTSKSY